MRTKNTTDKRADILIVDDTLANLKLLSELLRRRGFKVRATSNGKMALTAVETALPDLILLDIKMPEMDGYQVCKQLKAMSTAKDIPVIFISALEDTTDKVKAFTAGGVDYVGKPFQEEEVLARVESHLALARLQRELKLRNYELEASLKSLKEKQAEVLALQKREVLSEERERIMRDMHDGIGGLLVSTLAILEAGETNINKIETAICAALDDLRLMIDSLDPLEGKQLTLALGMFRARIMPRLQDCGLEIEWPVTDLTETNDLGPHKVLTILRILQEAITNVIKHAQASKLIVRVRQNIHQAEAVQTIIEVKDNGIGLSGNADNGRGMKNMRHRAQSLGAEIEIIDTGDGVSLLLYLPHITSTVVVPNNTNHEKSE